MPAVVSQSSMRTMTSWATSTRRRVRYPELAVRSAVSARPLRAPCVEMKYSRTLRPSEKLALMGRSMIRPVGSAISPRMPAIWRICWVDPRAPDCDIISTEWKRSNDFMVTSVTSSVALVQISTVFR